MTLSRRRLIWSTLVGTVLKQAGPAHASVSEDVRLAQPGVPLDISDIAPGSWRHFELEGRPVFVRRLTDTQIAERPKTVLDRRTAGKAEDEWVIVSGICTHQGCRVAAGLGAYRGFACFCHGSEYDVYGQVRQGPALQDLPVVPHAIKDGQLTLLATGAE